MSNPSCETCRHWHKPDSRTGFGDAVYISPSGEHPFTPADYRVARERQQEADRLFGECEVINLEAGTDLTVDSPLPLAVTRDGSDYRAHLYTQASFGCVLHEPT